MNPCYNTAIKGITMTIERVDTITEDSDEFKEEGDNYNFREIMDNIYVERDLILTIPADQESMLRQGLIIRKAKDNAKVKNAGVLPDGDILSFLSYPAKDKEKNDIPGLVDIRVKLGPKKSVTILEMRKPNDTF